MTILQLFPIVAGGGGGNIVIVPYLFPTPLTVITLLHWCGDFVLPYCYPLIPPSLVTYPRTGQTYCGGLLCPDHCVTVFRRDIVETLV